MIWSALDNIISKGAQLSIGIILARILMPSDFGLIAMLSVLITISQVFIDSGMASGLIQKRNKEERDYSTVFIFNFVISVTLYLLLYALAPLVASFYKMPQLITLTRVLSFNIIINSLAIVQRSIFVAKIDFRSIAKVNVISTIIGGGIAIYCAYIGLGVWSLVIHMISKSIISVIILMYLSTWKPKLLFSAKSFKELFGFGSKLLISALLSQVYNNVYNITIGKVFAPSILGYYTRAVSFAELTSGTVASIIHQVTYPILASLQDDKVKMISVYRSLIKVTSFIIFPTMTLLALLADSIVRVLLTDKWLAIVVLLQWMSFIRVFYPISVINLNILNAIGRSDLFLKVDLSKLPISIITLSITIPLGIEAMVVGQAITTIISFAINAYLPGKLFGYGAIQQINDMMKAFISTIIMAECVYIIISLVEYPIAKIFLGIISGIIAYIIMAIVLKVEELSEVKYFVEKIFKAKNDINTQ
jgi:teichuronic acid exporter